MVVQLQESQRQMKDALAVFKNALAANDPLQVADYQLNLEPDFRKAKQTLASKEVILCLYIICRQDSPRTQIAITYQKHFFESHRKSSKCPLPKEIVLFR